MTINVCIAGVTGWVGIPLSRAVHAAADLTLTGAVARSAAGRSLGSLLEISGLEVMVTASLDAALEAGCDVFVDYTHPTVAKTHVLKALSVGAHVVLGSSGLTENDFAEIDGAAKNVRRGVLAAGNFALTAALLQKFATLAALYIPHWEVIDYASAAKPDAPSGTARELAFRLGQVQTPQVAVPLEQTIGPRESRGATMGGGQVHSVRLPGYVASVEAIFGLPDMQLSLRHDAGTSAQPYVDGTLLAIRKVSGLTGLHRGLDTVMDS